MTRWAEDIVAGVMVILFALAVGAMYSGCPRDAVAEPAHDWQYIAIAADIYRQTPIMLVDAADDLSEVWEVRDVVVWKIQPGGTFGLRTEWRDPLVGEWRELTNDSPVTSMPLPNSALAVNSMTRGHPEYMQSIPQMVSTDLRLVASFFNDGILGVSYYARQVQ